MNEEKVVLRVKIPQDLSIILRFMRIKRGKGAYSEIIEKALREFLENHKEELKD